MQNFRTNLWTFFEKMAKNFVFFILRHFCGHAQGVPDFSRTNHLCQIIKLIGLYQHAKFQDDPMISFWEICEKPYFWSFWARFRHIWAQMGRTGIFFKNRASSLSSIYQSTPSCKKSEKINERIPRKMVTHARTHARTDRGEFIGPSRLKAGGPKTIHCASFSIVVCLDIKKALLYL